MSVIQEVIHRGFSFSKLSGELLHTELIVAEHRNKCQEKRVFSEGDYFQLGLDVKMQKSIHSIAGM